jgi:hypothetical protein
MAFQKDVELFIDQEEDTENTNNDNKNEDNVILIASSIQKLQEEVQKIQSLIAQKNKKSTYKQIGRSYK